jgi:ATP-dependent helicase HrpB
LVTTLFLMQLPIEATLPALRHALAAHSGVVLQAPTGAGKSTRVPLALLDEAWLSSQKIVMLEPRRLAARAVATRMAQTMGESVGTTVGYRTRLESRVSASTRIEVLTEGILTRWLQNDAALEGIGLVIFDEFHERSLNADLGLALCLDVQSTLREDLKLLVMSATLDGAAVATLLQNAPVVSSSGRSYPVEIRWAGVAPSQDAARNVGFPQRIEQHTANVTWRALHDDAGDVLVFLPGQSEIRRTQSLLQERGLPAGVRVFPLYGELGAELQDEALRPSTKGERKVVLATNIAETSLTIEGVRIVVDSGVARRARFDPATGMSRLETARISRASADQRCGRAGRLEAGVCYRLWRESDHATLPTHTPPEMIEADLAPLALELANWGARDPQSLRWLDVPPQATYAQARDLLKLLGAIDGQDLITPHGRELARLATHPRLAHMILRGRELGAQRTAIEIAALLGERDMLRFSGGERNVDLRLRLDALRDSRSAPPSSYVDEGARQRIKRSAEQLDRQLKSARNDSGNEVETGRLLAFAYPDRIAQSRGAGGRYLLSSGRGAQLPPAQSLAQCEYLVIADIDAGERDASIRLAAPITRAVLEADFKDLILERERVEWDSRERAVIAQRERWLSALRLEESRIDRPDPGHVLEALLRGIREIGLSRLPWSKEANHLRQRIAFARAHDIREPNPWPDVSDAALLASLEHWLGPWLPGMSRADHLSKLDMHSILSSLIDWNLQQRLNTFAPTHLSVPSGSRIPIDYDGESPTVSVRLQEVFGLHVTPTVAEGRVPLTIELLSPARRPVQITQDLASFWARGYAEVKKDLNGRYPKHYWPDDPMTAEATARAKARKS